MFHVKHDLGHDPAVEASDGFEYAPADAHNIGGPGPRSSPNRASILRPVDRCSRQPAVGGCEEQSEPRDISRQDNRCPKLFGCIRQRGCQSPDDPTTGARNSRSQRVAHGVGSRWVVWGEATVDHEVDVWWAQSSPRSSLRSCRTKNPPTRPARVLAVRFHVKQRRATSDSTETAIRERLVSTNWLLKTWAGDGGCLSLNAVPHAVLGVALSDRRILWDP